MAPKRVLDVGNCVPDHAAIKGMLERNFGAIVDRTHLLDDTLKALRGQNYDLVLVNRKLDEDYSDGLEIIKQLQSDETLKKIPMMLVTNYPDHQQLAVAAGAEWGFGKLELQKDETQQRLRRILAASPAPAK
jgi:two-component system chemotaxis response regulator CheY